jgi:hypothetical protein
MDFCSRLVGFYVFLTKIPLGWFVLKPFGTLENQSIFCLFVLIFLSAAIFCIGLTDFLQGNSVKAMIFGRSLTLVLLALGAAKAQLCADPGVLTCHPVVGDLPLLDGDLSDWADVVGIETSLYAPLTLQQYGPGKAKVKCAHSADDRIFMTLEIPGKYRFNATSNEMCAAVATMMKVGADAMYYTTWERAQMHRPGAMLRAACHPPVKPTRSTSVLIGSSPPPNKASLTPSTP